MLYYKRLLSHFKWDNTVKNLNEYKGIVEVINQKLGVDNREKITAGIKQRWLIVESAERQQSDIQKLNSKIEQEKKTVLKLAKKLETTGFDTVTKAQNYLK